MGEPILSGRQLKKVFDGTVAVDNVSFAIEEKTITAIIGPNGAGKTTLFNLITGFVAPDAGEISLQGNSLNGTPPYKIAQKGVSRTFQDLRLLRQLSVRDNLLLACPNQKGESFWPALLSSQVRKQTRAIEAMLRIMDFVGLNPLMYEPVAGVHPDMASQILQHLLQLKEQGRTIVFIEHDIEAVRKIGERVLVMDDGKVIASGPKNEVLANSQIIEAYLT